MTDPRRTPLRAAAALALAVALAPAVAGAHGGTFHDIWYGVLSPNCDSCHGPSGANQSGGMIASLDGFGLTEGGWYSVLVGVKPANSAAAALGKLRVTPYEPWNSLLLDKLSAHLKRGEGRPMPFGSRGYALTCPGALDKITKWILAGAPYNGVVDGDTAPFNVDCFALAQPAFSAPVPSGATQLLGDTLTVASPSSGLGTLREGELTSTRTLSVALDVGRIEIIASAGTEYVVVTRVGDDAPLAVARGAALDLHLPDGVAVPLAAGQAITIRQRIRNDYWAGGVNKTLGNVAVNLYPAAGTVGHEAKPFIDTTGTEALLVPPRLLGQTGGAWLGNGTNGAVVGIWADRKVIEASVADAASGTLNSDNLASANPQPVVTTGYVAAAGPALAYQCTHSNGFTNLNDNAQYLYTLSLLATTSLVNRPMKFACLEVAAVSPALPSVPAGTPAILGQAKATDCARSIHDPASSTPYGPAYDDSECTNATVDNCAPANLVGGEGVNDGRCSLIGLAW